MRSAPWLLVALAGMGITSAHAAACPDKQTLDAIASMGSVFIGEEHGTSETPAFVRCIVEHDLGKGKHPTVAIEQNSTSRDLASADWAGTDGRHSQAMASLVSWLIEKEKSGAISLHWMDDYTKSGETRDRDMGESLRPVVAKGLVIAYAGNVHAQKSQHLFSGYDTKPAGEYTAASMQHILVVSAGPGSAWNCIGDCGVHTEKGGAFGGAQGKLVSVASLGKDELMGYDYVYAYPSFTASPPARKPGNAPTTPAVMPST